MNAIKKLLPTDVARRRLLMQIGATVAAGATGTLPSLAWSQQRESATLASGGVNYTWALPFVAEVGSYWKKHNVDIKVVDFVTGRDSMQALLAGSAQFSTTTDTPFVFAVLRRLKPLVLANFSRYSHDMKLVASDRSGIDARTPASLKGKKIATPDGEMNKQFQTRILLKAHDRSRCSLPCKRRLISQYHREELSSRSTMDK